MSLPMAVVRVAPFCVPPGEPDFVFSRFRASLFSNNSRALGQVQQLDAFLNVGLIDGLMHRGVPQWAVLLVAVDL